MPVIWNYWVHATWSTLGHWLPGDPRGFRSFEHKIHSSGDYKHLPPEGEHEGLHEFSKSIAGAGIRIPVELRGSIGHAVLTKLWKIGLRARVLCVSAMHCHLLMRPGGGDAKPLVGRLKQASSLAVGDELPGSIWGQGCGVERIHDEGHYRRAVNYILEHRHDGAWVWDAKENPDAGPEGFRRSGSG